MGEILCMSKRIMSSSEITEDIAAERLVLQTLSRGPHSLIQIQAKTQLDSARLAFLLARLFRERRIEAEQKDEEVLYELSHL